MIEFKNVSFSYLSTDNKKINVLDNMNFKIEDGSFVAIAGENGSGKSTAAKLMNVLLTPSSGSIFIDGLETSKKENLAKIRRIEGFVFQNPDTQLLNSFVEEEVAFMSENLGFEADKIEENVTNALKDCGIEEIRHSQIQTLPAGKKQLVAIAAAIASQPKIMIFDEPTAFLDETERKIVLELIKKIHSEKKITVILITHHPDEAKLADFILQIEKGKIVFDSNYFSDENKSSISEFKERFLPYKTIFMENRKIQENENSQDELCLKVQDVSGISFELKKGETVFIEGNSGCGKSALLKAIKGFLIPDRGEVVYKGKNINSKKFDRRNYFLKTGICFQVAEQNLFAETVLDDVSYGLKNLGFDENSAIKKSKEMLLRLNFPEKLFSVSPNCLSGGQKRVVAIAGILVMEPEILLLDESDAGLDYKFVNAITETVSFMQKTNGICCVIATNSKQNKKSKVVA